MTEFSNNSTHLSKKSSTSPDRATTPPPDRSTISLQPPSSETTTGRPDAEVILYGSEARGDAYVGSDIDLLILLNIDRITLEDEEKITFPIYLLELKTGVLISPMVIAKKNWENRPFKTPFYINVMNEGVEL